MPKLDLNSIFGDAPPQENTFYESDINLDNIKKHVPDWIPQKPSIQPNKQIKLRTGKKTISPSHREAINIALSKSKKLKRHIIRYNKSRAKTFYFVNPQGKKITIKNLHGYTKRKGLSYFCMYRVAAGYRGSHKGYTKYA